MKLGALGVGFIGGLFGFFQLIGILVIETKRAEEKSGMLSSDSVFPVFGLLVMVEIMSVMALSMYRVSPWVARLVGEDAQAERISAGKRRYGKVLQYTTVATTFLRRAVVMIDDGHFSPALMASLSVALAPLLLPRPKV